MSPFVAAVALPFTVTLVLAAAGAGLPALRWRQAWAGLCALAGFLVGYVALEGWPPLVAVASKQKFFAIAVGGFAAPALVGTIARRRTTLAAALLWAACAAAWIGVRRLGELATILAVVLLVAGAALAMVSLEQLDRRRASSAAAPLIALGGGFAAIALQGASASLSLLAAAVAASAGAMALVAAVAELLRGEPLRLGASAASVFTVALTAIGAALLWFTPKVDLWALGVAALAPGSGLLTRLLPPAVTGSRAGGLRALIDPAVVLLFAGVPVAIAILLASRSAPLE